MTPERQRTEGKTTPGPWKNGGRLAGPGHVFGSNGRLVAGCLGHQSNIETDTESENQANARLIAKAPTMYTLLADVLEHTRRWPAFFQSNPADTDDWLQELGRLEARIENVLRED